VAVAGIAVADAAGVRETEPLPEGLLEAETDRVGAGAVAVAHSDGAGERVGLLLAKALALALTLAVGVPLALKHPVAVTEAEKKEVAEGDPPLVREARSVCVAPREPLSRALNEALPEALGCRESDGEAVPVAAALGESEPREDALAHEEALGEPEGVQVADVDEHAEAVTELVKHTDGVRCADRDANGHGDGLPDADCVAEELSVTVCEGQGEGLKEALRQALPVGVKVPQGVAETDTVCKRVTETLPEGLSVCVGEAVALAEL